MLARAAVKYKNINDRQSSFAYAQTRLGSPGARRNGRAVNVARANLTAMYLTIVTGVLPGLNFAYPREFEA